MIKLIATDMDGTLLDDNKQLPQNFDNIVKRLFKKISDLLFQVAEATAR